MASYYCNSNMADQGAARDEDDFVCGPESLKEIVDFIGTTNKATIIFEARPVAQTTYTLTTSEAVPSNITLRPESGAVFDGAGTLTLDNPEQLDAPPTQQIFGSSITLAFTNPGTAYLEWRGLGAGATDSKDAFDLFINAFPAVGGTIQMLGGTYTTSGIEIHSISNIKIFGSGPMTTLRPYWPGGAYDDTTYGKSTFNIQDGSNYEIAHFKYDGRFSDGLTTVTYPSFLWTFNNIADPADNISVHHIYGFNGGGVQDKVFAAFYDSKNILFDHNTVLGFDTAAQVSIENNENCIVTNNIILGGASEGVSIYQAPGDPTLHDRRVIVSNNIIDGKAAAAVIVYNVKNANVIISLNILGTTEQSETLNAGKGIALYDCDNVLVSVNTFTGPGQFVYLYGATADDINIINNKVKWTSNFLNNDISGILTNTIITGNSVQGIASAPAYSAAVTYKPGEYVSSGGSYYYCILESLNNVPPNATYWTVDTGGAAHVNGSFEGLVLSFNQFTDTLARAVSITEINNSIIENNQFLNGDAPNVIGADVTKTMENVKVIGNAFVVANATDPALSSTSLWLKNCDFSHNYFETAGSYGTVAFANRIVQATRFTDNTIEGAHVSAAFSEAYGTLKKRDNTATKSAYIDNDVPTNGYVNIGETFYKTDPAAAGTMGSVCTTAGYAYKEAYNAANAYVVGEHVLGSDTKVYRCILDDSGAAANAPTTGGSWATYWVLAEAAGTPLAVMKTFGAITA